MKKHLLLILGFVAVAAQAIADATTPATTNVVQGMLAQIVDWLTTPLGTMATCSVGTWVVTWAVNNHLFDWMGVKDASNIGIRVVSYVTAATIAVLSHFAKHTDLNLATINGAAHTAQDALFGAWAAKAIHDKLTPPDAPVAASKQG